MTQAASIGVPVLTTDYPLGRFLADRFAGVACEADPTALKVGIREVLRPEAAALGSRARDVVQRELNWPLVARSWLSQVEELLGSGRLSSRSCI